MNMISDLLSFGLYLASPIVTWLSFMAMMATPLALVMFMVHRHYDSDSSDSSGESSQNEAQGRAA